MFEDDMIEVNVSPFECPICFECYDKVMHIPTTFLCGHSCCLHHTITMKACHICHDQIPYQQCYPNIALRDGAVLYQQLNESFKTPSSVSSLTRKEIKSVTPEEKISGENLNMAFDSKSFYGEILYPLVEDMYPLRAGKIVGMFLESMCDSELMHLIDNSEELQKMVTEAMKVLDVHAASIAPEPAATPVTVKTTLGKSDVMTYVVSQVVPPPETITDQMDVLPKESKSGAGAVTVVSELKLPSTAVGPPPTPDRFVSNVTSKSCGHQCSLTIDRCCACMDKRPLSASGVYQAYHDGHRFTTVGRREFYCPHCKIERTMEKASTAVAANFPNKRKLKR